MICLRKILHFNNCSKLDAFVDKHKNCVLLNSLQGITHERGETKNKIPLNSMSDSAGNSL